MTTVSVLFSGGLDSYLAFLMSVKRGHTTRAVFVDYGQPYINKERKAVKKLLGNSPSLVKIRADLCQVPAFNNNPTIDRQEVYGRNLLLAFYGAQVGEEVWLSALETEINPTAVRDKHPEFASMASAILTYVFKSKRLETRVVYPLAQYTKSEIVHTALNMGWTTTRKLQATVSCYDPDHHNCGRCSTCFKRWIAMVNNKVPEHYHSNPWESDYARKVCKEMRKAAKVPMTEDERKLTRYSMKRLIETNQALVAIGQKPILRDG